MTTVRKIPILTYHSIDRSGSVISTSPEMFRQQMTILSEANCRVVSLRKLIEIFDSPKDVPENIVALTFDDGFQNFYTEAFPILLQYRFDATVFLVTDFCGKNNDWSGNPANLPRKDLLSWEQIKELNCAGIEFGAHTRTHPDLTEIPIEQAAREIIESKNIIEAAIGNKTTTFAYPYGKFDSAIKEIVANAFDAACSTNLGKARAGDDCFSLARIDAFYLSNPVVFRLLSSKIFDPYLHFRQLLRSLKPLVLQS